MKELTVYRPIELFNFFRGYSIYINGERVFSLKNGEKKSIAASPEAVIEARIDWCKSNTLNSNQRSVVVQSNKILTYLLLITLYLAIGLYFYDPAIVKYAFCPLGIVLLYFLTFGKNHLLHLTEL